MMETLINPFRELFDSGIKYLKARFEYEKLSMFEKLSAFVSGIFTTIATVILGLIGVIFLISSLAIWLGELLGSYALGMLSGGLLFLLIAYFISAIGDKLFKGVVTKLLLGLLMPNKEVVAKEKLEQETKIMQEAFQKA